MRCGCKCVKSDVPAVQPEESRVGDRGGGEDDGREEGRCGVEGEGWSE